MEIVKSFQRVGMFHTGFPLYPLFKIARSSALVFQEHREDLSGSALAGASSPISTADITFPKLWSSFMLTFDFDLNVRLRDFDVYPCNGLGLGVDLI